MPATAERSLLVEKMVRELAQPYPVTGKALSASKVAHYLRCPRSYKYQYIEKQPSPTSPAAGVGSLVHKVVQHCHLEGWGVEHAEEAAYLLVDVWGAYRDQTSDPDDPIAQRSVEDAACIWLPWYLGWKANQIDVAVEERWRVEVPGTSIELRGTMDRVYRAHGETVISDVKSGKQKPTPVAMATDLQLSLYAWAWRELAGRPPDWVEIVHLRGCENLRSLRNDGAYLDAVISEVVVPVAEAIEAGHFPANPGTRYGCGYCDYIDRCPVGQTGAEL